MTTQKKDLSHILYEEVYSNSTIHNNIHFNGSGHGFDSVQSILKNDTTALETQVRIFQEKYLPSKKKQWIKPDLLFFEGYLAADKTQMEQAIALLLTPRTHNNRNKPHPLRKQYISIPALTYAKLAWLKGFEVTIDHPLVPKDFLPVQPLDTYREEYDFFKEVDV